MGDIMQRLHGLALFTLLVWTAAALPGQSYSINTVAGLTTAREGGRAVEAALRDPWGLAADPAGNIYISEIGGHRVRRVSPDGAITTIAGTGRRGFAGDGGNARDAALAAPASLALDAQGNLYIADYGNSRVRRVNLATGIITTVAGTGNFRFGGDGGPALQAGIDPVGVAVRENLLYIADTSNQRIRRMDLTTGVITTYAGIGVRGDSGDGGPATQAALANPNSLALDGAGNLYIADLSNRRIRRVTPDGRIAAFAGSNAATASTAEGIPAINARLPGIGTVSADAQGNVVLIAGITVRQVNPQGFINTIAGSPTTLGFTADGASAVGSPLAEPVSALLLANGDVLVAELGRVRRVSRGQLGTVAGATITDNTPALQSIFNFPSAVASDAAGNIYISDTQNHRLRKLDTNGTVSTLTGTGLTRGTGNILDSPAGLLVDRDGTIVVTESGYNRVVRVNTNGSIQPVAGIGEPPGFSGDAGPAVQAQFFVPTDVALDANQNLYIADYNNFRVRRVSPDGVVTTVAGNGQPGFGGDGGAATAARIDPFGIAVDATGRLLIADALNHRIRSVDPRTGVINTIAGVGSPGFSGDGGPATQAQLFTPFGVAVDAAGNIFIADTGNGRIRRIAPTGIITTIAGTGGFATAAETGAATAVAIFPVYVHVERTGNLLVADAGNDRIRRLTPVAARALAIVSGNNQSGVPGAKLALAVRVTGDGDTPIANAAVSFTVSGAGGTVSPAMASSGPDGVARTEVTLGLTPGAVTVTAASPGLPPVTFNLTINPAVPTRPAPRIGGVVGAGLSVPAVRTLSAGAIASVFGENFASAGTLRSVAAGDLVNGRVPESFAGVCVTVGGVRAPVYLVSPGQINFQVPVSALGRSEVRVLAGCGLADEAASAPVTVDYAAQSPEFFYFVTRADGANPVAATDAVTGALVGAPGLIAGANFTPGRPDQLVTIYLTGLGDTDPPVAPGEIPQAIARIRASLRITLGGVEVPANRILYAGIAPFNPGLYQINFYIPADAAAGDLPLVVTAGSAVTPPGGFLTVAR
jgi:uncharacterized protein (TIGR03437 family)